jgi:hypothetical protein
MFVCRGRINVEGDLTRHVLGSRWVHPGGRNKFCPFQTDFASNTLSYAMGTLGLFLGVKRPQREAGHSPCLKQRLRISQAKPLPLPVYLIACYRATFTFFLTFCIKDQRDNTLGQSPYYIICNKN